LKIPKGLSDAVNYPEIYKNTFHIKGSYLMELFSCEISSGRTYIIFDYFMWALFHKSKFLARKIYIVLFRVSMQTLFLNQMLNKWVETYPLLASCVLIVAWITIQCIYIYIYIYVWKLNQTVLELDFRAVKFLFFPRRDLNPHHWYTAAPFA
jgi:hypothetical protein